MGKSPLRVGSSLEYGGKRWKVVHAFQKDEQWQVHLKKGSRRARHNPAAPLEITLSLEELLRNNVIFI